MIEQYLKSINANEEVVNWFKTTGTKSLKKQLITESDMEHVIDYLVSSAAPKRLRKMSLKDAKRKSDEWSKANQKKGRNLVDDEGDIETIHDFLDGRKIVRLKTKKALEREGFLMSHCVGGYNPNDEECHIYSYRDKANTPHATFEVRKNEGEIVQIKGKGNGAIHPKYIDPILEFLRSIEIDIRPNDMKNLGYYHVPDEHKEFLKQLSGVNKKLTVINGVSYAF